MATTMMFVYLLSGSFFAVVLLTWSLRSGQFDDQDRARFLAMRRDPGEEPYEQAATKAAGRPLTTWLTAGVVLAVGLGTLVRMLLQLVRNG